MNERLLKTLIYIAGGVCLYAFIAIRIPPMFNFVLKEKIIPEYWENTKYGELYYFSHIRNFQEKDLPPHAEKYRYTEKHPSFSEADLILFGDSFFDFTRMKTFPEALGDSLNQRVFYARNDQPLQYMSEQKIDSKDEKILIFESAERYIPTRFSRAHSSELIQDPRSSIRASVSSALDYIFVPQTDVLYGTLLSRCRFTTGLHTSISTFKFNTFGYITDLTPSYSLKEEVPWLFYYEQLNEEPSSYYYQHTQDEIDLYCDNIADLSLKLKQKYNLKMVFMGIPSKYTIYHKLINKDPYNDFLPRIYEGLEKREIPYIPLYEDFKSSDQVLYYGTDTHWNEIGLSMALDNTIEILNTLY